MNKAFFLGLGCIHAVSWSCESMYASWMAPSHLLTAKLVHLQHEMLTVSMLEPRCHSVCLCLSNEDELFIQFYYFWLFRVFYRVL